MAGLFLSLRAPVRSAAAAAATLVGLLWVLAGPAAAMTFQKTTDAPGCAERACVLAAGVIDKASPDDLDAFLRAQRIGPGALVILDSPGGVVLYGLALGERIRRAGLDTAVAGGAAKRECASACVFSFLGGVQRSVGPGGRIGVHQIYANPAARDGLSVADAEWLASQIAMYDERMGGGVGILVLALRTAPGAIHWFTPRELTTLSVVRPAPTVIAALEGER